MASNNLSQYNYCWFSRCFLTFLAVSCYFLLTLHTSSRADTSFGWRMGGYVIYIYGKRLLDALFLTPRNLANSSQWSKTKQQQMPMGMFCRHTVPVPIVQCPMGMVYCMDCIYAYQRGLLRCSFRLLWAMREPRGVGRVTGTDSHVFSYPHVTICKHAESGEFIGDKTYKQL